MIAAVLGSSGLLPSQDAAGRDHRAAAGLLKARLHLVFRAEDAAEESVLIDKEHRLVVGTDDANQLLGLVWRRPAADQAGPILLVDGVQVTLRSLKAGSVVWG